MRNQMIIFLLLLTASLHVSAQQPQLLILGTAHLNNPGRDIFNIEVDDVLTPKRQTDIAEIVRHLALYRPTQVALECSLEQQEEYTRRYAEYRAGRYKLSRNERDQIGMRLAAMLNLPSVQCVDYQNGPPGPPEPYDFMTFAQNHIEMKPLVDAMMSTGKEVTGDEATYLRSHALIDWYRRANEPLRLQRSNQVYIQYIADIGNSQEHPGANWVGGWHTRNMIIVGNLRHLARPGDRVFALFGAGHAYLLKEFARDSAAFNVVNAETYLR